MITPYVPRLSQSGGQRHSFYTLKYLSQKNNITLICYSRSQEGIDDLKKYCQKVVFVQRGPTWNLKNILAAAFSRYPFLLLNYINSEFRKAIETEINTGRFSLIHCDCLYPMPNIPQTDIPVILVDVTIEYAIYEHFTQSLSGWKKIIAPILYYDVLKLKYWETKYWKNTHTVIMFSDDDRKFVEKYTGRRDIQVFEDGVDPEYFALPQKTGRSPDPVILSGVSNMKWMQNRESTDLILQNYWPQIKAKYPRSKLYIIGRYAKDFFGHLKSADIIVDEADLEGQPHDLQYYYEYSWILLAPMGSGGGTRNKFLEGMTFGMPVITNPEGGMGNIKIKNYHHAIVCPSTEILKNVYDLIDHPQKRAEIGRHARELIKSNYSFDTSVEKLNGIYEKITKK